MTDELLRLAAICEHEAPDFTASLLHQTYVAIFGHPPDDWPRDSAGCDKAHGNRFVDMVNVGAYIDAAMMLIPEAMRDEIGITTLYCVARVSINMNHGPDDGPFYGNNDCNSIPLAICAAALKARASMENTNGN